MKEITIELCGCPDNEYRPIVLLTDNCNIRRSAEKMANERYTYGWIDNAGVIHDITNPHGRGTDLYVETSARWCHIENSSYRSNV